MFIITADTYMGSYGSEYYIFGVYSSRDECETFIKNYNKEASDFENWIKEHTDEDAATLKFKGKDKVFFEKMSKKFQIYDLCGYFEIFKFDEKRLDFYIKEFNNEGKPLCVGGYIE